MCVICMSVRASEFHYSVGFKVMYSVSFCILLLLFNYIYIFSTSYYLIKVSRDHIPSQYGPCYGSNQGDI